MRKTKILCTVGPATQSVEMLQQLVKAGANVFRLNMSHSPHEVVRRASCDGRVRRASRRQTVGGRTAGGRLGGRLAAGRD